MHLHHPMGLNDHTKRRSLEWPQNGVFPRDRPMSGSVGNVGQWIATKWPLIPMRCCRSGKRSCSSCLQFRGTSDGILSKLWRFWWPFSSGNSRFWRMGMAWVCPFPVSRGTQLGYDPFIFRYGSFYTATLQGYLNHQLGFMRRSIPSLWEILDIVRIDLSWDDHRPSSTHSFGILWFQPTAKYLSPSRLMGNSREGSSNWCLYQKKNVKICVGWCGDLSS